MPKIVLDVKEPKEKCEDENCPFHGSLRCRGRTFIGTIISTKMHKTAVAESVRKHYIKKYERYEKRRTKIKAHNPLCINAKEGDIVRMMECRQLSKTKNFVIIEKMGKEKGFKERIEALEAAKFKETKKELEKEEGEEQDA